MLTHRFRFMCLVLAGLLVLVVPVFAEDAATPNDAATPSDAAAPNDAAAPSDASKGQTKTTEKASPFSDGETSGQPCELPGPCGRCDCPDPTK